MAARGAGGQQPARLPTIGFLGESTSLAQSERTAAFVQRLRELGWARLAELGSTALPGSPGDFGKLIAEETEKWGKVVKFADIKPR